MKAHLTVCSTICAGIFIFSSSLLAQGFRNRAEIITQDVLNAKGRFTSAQQKIDSALVFAGKKSRGELTGISFSNAIPNIPANVDGLITIDIQLDPQASVDAVAGRLAALGGQVVFQSAEFHWVRARIALANVEALAADNAVRSISQEDKMLHGAGTMSTQGVISHSARDVVSSLGYTGKGVKVGVLSDSASAARVAALIASGDLAPNTTVLPGLGSSGTDEGTAMMEIVQDMAPGAQIFFATANGGQAGFAANIAALAKAGCTIIVDDVYYTQEPVFQDGPIALAINAFTANGGLYFSAAGNSGSLSNATASTWESDFKDGGPATTPGGGTVHSFGAQNYNTFTNIGAYYIALKWADPLGGSTNDYDLFIYDSTATTLKAMSTNTQNGTQDPAEVILVDDLCGTGLQTGYCPAIGDRIVIVRKANAAARAMHLDAGQGTLSISTGGSTFGHGSSAAAITVAASSWDSAKTGTKAFTTAGVTEIFSSDGPRTMFYAPDGTPFTKGNFLFATNGGVVLKKPDLTAADGVGTNTPGFFPFYGTSAAAPHAAGIAALVQSARPNYTNAEIKNALLSTAVDNMMPGWDRDGGYGLANALAAVQFALAH